MSDKKTSTIPEFCLAHGISRTHFYALCNVGRGPRIMKLGKKTLVSEEAAADWRAAMEGPFDPALNVGLKPWSQKPAPTTPATDEPAPVKRGPGRPRKVQPAPAVAA